MTRQIINEGLDYHDLVGQIEPTITVDEYVAKMGDNAHVITLAFIVNSEAAGNDLVEWFERGYSFILDASLSEGEIAIGKYVVFVEMNRRSTAPERIIELLEDLETLTDLSLEDWTIEIEEEEHTPSEELLKRLMVLSPQAYRDENGDEEEDGEDSIDTDEEPEEEPVDTVEPEEMNEMRIAAGISPKRLHTEQDADLRAFKAMAGL